jgi:hypothetical protein
LSFKYSCSKLSNVPEKERKRTFKNCDFYTIFRKVLVISKPGADLAFSARRGAGFPWGGT